MRETSADTARAAQELGFRPSINFEEGLRQEFEWSLERARGSIERRLSRAGSAR